MSGRADLGRRFAWSVAGDGWTVAEIGALFEAGTRLVGWLARHASPLEAETGVRAAWGGTTFMHANLLGRALRRCHAESDRIFFHGDWTRRPPPRRAAALVVHELGHVLDNRTNPRCNARLPWFLRDADIRGGGVSDAMARRLGGDPRRCLLRFGWLPGWHAPYAEPPPTAYGRNGPSEDFADSFMLAVMDAPGHPLTGARAAFMEELARDLACGGFGEGIDVGRSMF